MSISLDNSPPSTLKVKAGPRWVLADGMNISAIREIKLLREIEHPNVMCLQDVFSQDFCICLVFEFMESDLEAVLRDTSVILTPANIKSLSLQVCYYYIFHL